MIWIRQDDAQGALRAVSPALRAVMTVGCVGQQLVLRDVVQPRVACGGTWPRKWHCRVADAPQRDDGVYRLIVG